MSLNKLNSMIKSDDYLHLYIGCDYKLTCWGPYGAIIKLGAGDIGASFRDGKLVLRHLSDMIEEESGQYWAIIAETNSFHHQIERDSERTRYLLSRGFDLFGLIESGLAIDKATLS